MGFNILYVKESCNNNMIDALAQYSIEHLNCLGVEEFNLEESQIDEELGKQAFVWANLPEEEFRTLEENASTGIYKFIFEDSNLLGIEEFFNLITSNDLDLVKKENIENADWMENWKKSYEIITINNIKVVPSWKKTTNLKTDVYIYPGQGFGTGSHETTSLCITLFQHLNDSFKSNCKTVLDLGTGSGILAILALKDMPKVKAVLSDIDLSALENSKYNLDLNEIDESRYTLMSREETKCEKFDLIFANILLSALQTECDFIFSSLEKNGKLIVSGLLEEQKDEFFETFVFGKFEVEKIIGKNDWIAITLIKK